MTLEGWELDRTVWDEFEKVAEDFTVVSEINEPVISWTDNWVLRDPPDFSNLIIWAFKWEISDFREEIREREDVIHRGR